MWATLLAVLPLALLVTWRATPPNAGLPGASPAYERARERVGGGPAERRPAAPRPAVVSRVEWGADDGLRDDPVTYTGAARAVFIHHTGHPDDYDCADAPAMLRAMYADHVLRLGWDDLGYNFVVDKCGTIYEGRAGGIDRFVLGAHTTGFNHDSVGIAALGDFSYAEAVPEPLLDAVAQIAAWKLRPGADPRGRVRLVSSNDASRVPEGTAAEVDVVAGHRDIFYTHCPGDVIYAALPEIRARTDRLRAEAAKAAEAAETEESRSDADADVDADAGPARADAAR
ncbi:peptidoglycan recognition protein family protein [Streptomyces sp. 6N223]|uniref:peptidoglycan recognition protein family protein n=1 Tax=Streptomyces sp. 6N223 TaxID=3457412 RepID=UPI003FD60D28